MLGLDELLLHPLPCLQLDKFLAEGSGARARGGGLLLDFGVAINLNDNNGCAVEANANRLRAPERSTTHANHNFSDIMTSFRPTSAAWPSIVASAGRDSHAAFQISNRGGQGRLAQERRAAMRLRRRTLPACSHERRN
jgi:hypothetical protein